MKRGTCEKIEASKRFGSKPHKIKDRLLPGEYIGLDTNSKILKIFYELALPEIDQELFKYDLEFEKIYISAAIISYGYMIPNMRPKCCFISDLISQKTEFIKKELS
ncbi:uncharacterized protein LOC142330353 [Lycorma delicatula]|uniref:uncharacterized protein LOC142330353 n=1 Tax=Lycorma delicatula TaxID=130591 RepID=UPI003F50D4AA